MPSRFRPGMSGDAFAAAKADEAAQSAKLRWRKRNKYPGRNRLLAREDAADFKMRQLVADRDNRKDRFACVNPYVIYGIGLPAATTALADWRWSGRNKGKIPVEFETRCRKCDPCLMHRRRLWTARAIDEVKASNRTWFGTLTINPYERFLITLEAAAKAKRTGHGEWRDIPEANQYAFLVDAAAPQITKWLKRVRKVSRTSLRYLLVAEAHKDGFPHFHVLIHEPALPVTKAQLETQWRLGFSHWRLVDREDPRSAYYACKYLAKDARTRVRASVRYGRPQLIAASTERMRKATQLAGNPSACPSGSPEVGNGIPGTGRPVMKVSANDHQQENEE